MSSAHGFDETFRKIDQLRRECPELRFGQLIAIIGNLAEDETGHSLWDVEDADFAAATDRFADEISRRGSDEGGSGATPTITPLAGSTAPEPPKQVG
jgi:hypothetical protein